MAEVHRPSLLQTQNQYFSTNGLYMQMCCKKPMHLLPILARHTNLSVCPQCYQTTHLSIAPPQQTITIYTYIPS